MTASRHVAVLLFIAATVALWIGLRVGFGIGWGAIDRPGEAAEIPLGIAHGVLDNLSYVAWAEQAKDGLIPFAVLQTTEPHEAVFVAPVFLGLGGLARLLDVHPLVVLNLAGLAAGALMLYLVCRAALALGLSFRAAFLAMAFCTYGSGLSVLLRLLFGEVEAFYGADATYLDLFPASALPYFPYHALGLATMAALLLGLVRAEAALAAGDAALRPLATVFLLGLLAVAVRPYAPVSLTVVYAGLAALALVKGNRTWLKLAVALVLGVGPLALYYRWVAAQPVWDAFAAQSLALDYSRVGWLIGFGLFWPAAAAGAMLAWRRRQRQLAPLALWAGFAFLLLVGLALPESKLADTGFIALALLSAYAVDAALVRLVAASPFLRAPAVLALGLAILASGLGTFALIVQGRGEDYRPVDAELVRAAQAIRAERPDGRPAVLTEVYASALLPAIASLRVYAGHWSLTLDPEAKVARLKAAGFEPANGADAAALDALFAETRFDYVLARKGRAVMALLDGRPELTPLWEGRRWRLYRVARVG